MPADNLARWIEPRARFLHRPHRPRLASDTRKRPVWRFEAAAVQQHDAVVLGQAESKIERMDVLLQVLDGIFADVLPRPELEVDQAVVGVVERVRRQLQARPSSSA